MTIEILFDKEKFCNFNSGTLKKEREEFLAKIEFYRTIDSEMVKWLEWYRDLLWQDQLKKEKFRQDFHNLGEKEYNKRVAIALRAMADKIEQPGMHFIIGADLPKLPIFSGDDYVERYNAHIEVSIVAYPLGG